MPRKPAVVVAALLVLALVAGLAWWLTRPGSRLEEAARLAPQDTQRLLWTDWAGVRTATGVADARSEAGLDALLEAGYDADLTSTSALIGSSQPMRDRLGVSPANVEWELYAQGTDGAALFLRLPEDLDLSDVSERLERLGYARPGDEDGVWTGGEDVAVQAGFSPELQHVALLADRHLLVAADAADYLETAVATATGDRDPTGTLDEVVEGAGDAVTGVLLTGTYACEHQAMSQSDAATQSEAEALIERAGGVGPYRAMALVAGDEPRLSALFAYEDEDRARADLDPRTELARGPALGQGGDFGERFTLRDSVAEGPLLRMTLDPVAGVPVLSDLSSGPLLFAGC